MTEIVCQYFFLLIVGEQVLLSPYGVPSGVVLRRFHSNNHMT